MLCERKRLEHPAAGWVRGADRLVALEPHLTAERASANVGRGEPRTLYPFEKSPPNDETVRAADPAEKVHHHLRITKRQVRGEDEARMPTRRCRLEAAVLLVSELEEQHQGVRERHERMFPYRRSALDDAAAAALERGQPPELAHVSKVVFRTERRGHSRKVSDRGDLGTHAATERLSPGGAA